jgi:hypothetical protein
MHLALKLQQHVVSDNTPFPFDPAKINAKDPETMTTFATG